MTSSRNLLHLDQRVVRRARKLAEKAAAPVIELARTHTTVSVERAVLRLGGLTGADAEGIPLVNRLVDAARADVGLEHGAALPVWDALLQGDHADLSVLAQKAAAGGVRFRIPEGRELTRARSAAADPGAGVRRRKRGGEAPAASMRPAATASGCPAGSGTRRGRGST